MRLNNNGAYSLGLRHYDYFVKIYELENITRAAQELYVSQQAVSFALKEFEQAVGQALFFRSKQGVEPTETATWLYPLVKEVLTSNNNLQAVIAQSKNTSKGTISIAIANAIEFPYGVGLLRMNCLFDLVSYCKKELHYKLDYVIESQDNIEVLLKNESVLFALCLGNHFGPDFTSTPLSEDHLYVYANKADSLSKKASISASDLVDKTLIVLDSQPYYKQLIQDIFRDSNLVPRFKEVSQLPISYVLKDEGVMICPMISTIVSDDICAVLLDSLHRFRVNLLRLSKTAFSETEQVLCNYIVQTFAAQ